VCPLLRVVKRRHGCAGLKPRARPATRLFCLATTPVQSSRLSLTGTLVLDDHGGEDPGDVPSAHDSCVYGAVVDRYRAIARTASHPFAAVEFGGPVDNLTDDPPGLVVTLRVFGELAFRVIDPSVLLAKLM
jgi:hypothetical protein